MSSNLYVKWIETMHNKQKNRIEKERITQKLTKTLRYSISNCKSFDWCIFHNVYEY